MGTGETSFLPKIWTSSGRGAVTSQRPEIVYRPDDRTEAADLPDVMNSKKIAVSIVKVYYINLMFMDKGTDFLKTVGDS